MALRLSAGVPSGLAGGLRMVKEMGENEGGVQGDRVGTGEGNMQAVNKSRFFVNLQSAVYLHGL